MQLIKKFTSIRSFVLLCIFYTWVSFFYYPKYKMPASEALISWDVSGYYQYLPAIFINKDIRYLKFAEANRNKYQYSPNTDQFYEIEGGRKVIKYSLGMSVFYLPAFAAGHTWALITGADANGYSRPYQLMLFVQGLLVTLLGFWLLRRFLLRHFDDWVVGWTLLIIGFGTNLIEYGAITNAMSHNYLFLCYTILLLLCEDMKDRISLKSATHIGAIIGLMALARPTEVLAGLIPLLYIARVHNGYFLSKILESWKAILWALTVLLGIGSLQLLYWKYVSGSWVQYSYQEQGFSWLSPHIIDGLFSFRAGWLIYTPIMLLSLIGMIIWFKAKEWMSTVIVYFVIFTYVAFAWDIWWYGGSLGQRTMVQIYPLLALPIANVLAIKKGRFSKSMLSLFIAIGIYLNLWLVHGAHKGAVIEVGNMTRHYYMAVVGRSNVAPETKKLLDARYIHTEPLKDINIAFESNDTTCLNSEVQFNDTRYITPSSKHKYFRVTCTFDNKTPEWEFWKYTQLIIKYKKGNRQKTNMLRLQRMDNTSGNHTTYLDSKIPRWADNAEVYLWHAGSQSNLCITSLKGEFYN